MLFLSEKRDVAAIPSVFPSGYISGSCYRDSKMQSHIIYFLIKNVAESSGEAGFHAGSLAHRHQSVPVPVGVS